MSWGSASTDIDYSRVYFAVFQFWQSKTDLYSRSSRNCPIQIVMCVCVERRIHRRYNIHSLVNLLKRGRPRWNVSAAELHAFPADANWWMFASYSTRVLCLALTHTLTHTLVHPHTRTHMHPTPTHQPTLAVTAADYPPAPRRMGDRFSTEKLAPLPPPPPPPPPLTPLYTRRGGVLIRVTDDVRWKVARQNLSLLHPPRRQG